MWGCEDVDLQVWGCEDVDQQMWGREDVLQRLLFYEQPSQALSGKISAGCRIKICTALHRLVCCSIVGIYHHKCLWAINLYMSKYIHIYMCMLIYGDILDNYLWAVFSIQLYRAKMFAICLSNIQINSSPSQTKLLVVWVCCMYLCYCACIHAIYIYISIHTQTF